MSYEISYITLTEEKTTITAKILCTITKQWKLGYKLDMKFDNFKNDMIN